tara:strand:- start:2215 stop:3285 length:1071 start_codon:yes stop_codon:yes gene_type:complete
MRYLKYLDIHGFPIKKTPNNKIKLLKQEKIYLFSKFKRRFDVCFSLPTFDLIKNFYNDEILEEYYLDKLRTVKLFFSFKIHLKLLTILNYFFFPKKIINLNNADIVLFGPYSHNYSHALHEFFTRLIFLKKKNKKFNVFLPKTLKKILSSKTYKLIFSKKNFNFKFFDTDTDIEFRNCNYLTHPNNRWVIKGKKKKISDEYKYLLNELRKEVTENKISGQNKSNAEYIFVSRSNALSRRLLNEDELFNQLKKYGFKKVFFENLSYEKQVELSMNCKIMIGYHGAGLTNSIFMKKKSYLIEIYNKHYEHEHFKLFSMCQKIKYKNFQCKENKKNLNGVCDIQEVKDYIINIKRKTKN